jgi:excisionase family DNA binding protein
MRHHELSTTATLANSEASNPEALYELLTVDELAAWLKVTKSWVYEHTRARGTPRSDRLPHVKIGKYVRFDPRLVRAFLDRRTAR